MILKGQGRQFKVLFVVVQRIRDVENGCRKAKGKMEFRSTKLTEELRR
jgi:hypothetical protein